MIKYFGIISILVQLSLSCRVTSDWLAPTIEESFELAGAVVVGTSLRNIQTLGPIVREISLESTEFHKGCGPSTIHVKGFSSGTTCGFSAPQTGRKVILFLCISEDQKTWGLHNFSAYTGVFEATDDNLAKLKVLKSSNKSCNSNEVSFEECKKRSPSKVAKPPSQLRIEPEIILVREADTGEDPTLILVEND